MMFGFVTSLVFLSSVHTQVGLPESRLPPPSAVSGPQEPSQVSREEAQCEKLLLTIKQAVVTGGQRSPVRQIPTSLPTVVFYWTLTTFPSSSVLLPPSVRPQASMSLSPEQSPAPCSLSSAFSPASKPSHSGGINVNAAPFQSVQAVRRLPWATSNDSTGKYVFTLSNPNFLFFPKKNYYVLNIDRWNLFFFWYGCQKNLQSKYRTVKLNATLSLKNYFK